MKVKKNDRDLRRHKLLNIFEERVKNLRYLLYFLHKNTQKWDMLSAYSTGM